MKKNIITLSLESLLNANAHLGEKTTVRHPDQSVRILAYKGNKDLINLEKTLEDLRPALQIITETVANREQVLVIAQNNVSENGFETIVTKENINEFLKTVAAFPQPIITGRWVYGALSNFKTTRFSKKNSVKEIPNAVILLYTNAGDLILNETKFLGIPTITIQQTTENPHKSQYSILTNKNELKTTTLLLQLFAKATYYGYAKQILKFKQRRKN